MFELFESSHLILRGKQADSLNKFEKNFLEFMLKIVRVLLMAGVRTTDQDVFKAITSLKKGASKKEEGSDNLKKSEEGNEAIPAEIYETPKKNQVVDVYDPSNINEEMLFGPQLPPQLV